MNNYYKKQVRLLLRILPIIYKEKDFAIHGGTAINMFVKNMLRYSVDVDLTYIPIEDRTTSLNNINSKLSAIKMEIERAFPGIKVTPVPNKLLCILDTVTVKIEVNGIQRGIIGTTTDYPLCDNARAAFELFATARVVSISQLYGGKIGAALNRQHPRDLFDFKYMDISDFETVKHGLIYNLLSSPKPVVELLAPNPINQTEALKNQFHGMTDITFAYEDYEQKRKQLVDFVNSNLKSSDKEFLLGFEAGTPLWENSEYDYFVNYPSIQWKLLNINKLKIDNPAKYKQGLNKLEKWLNIQY
ncbi:MAG: nucleotidyl transferase AbiEii/AbiGii toxin family protein [Planctomycetaceae bacterium]|jgi:hypothetical protein|nr:nucleotidyl transferase AbiEii/AbiGii toxin family protein [Planctomycetaceae bacterium]